MMSDPDKPPITPAEFKKQQAAALAEIKAKGSLSWTTSGGRKETWFVRCGSPLDRGQRCLRRRGHDADCEPRWA